MSKKGDWWLAALSPHGYAFELLDGPHSDKSGVEQALYLHYQLGLGGKGVEYCAAKVQHFPVNPKPHDVNHDALDACKAMVAGNLGKVSE